MNMNQVNIMGRLTADPELHIIDEDKCVCNVVVACERRDREKVDFIRCVAWNKKAQFLCEWFAKGRMVALSGALRTRSYEQNGEKRYLTEVQIIDIFFTGEYAAKNQEEELDVQLKDTVSESGWNNDFDLSEFEEILSDEEIPF